MRLACLMVANGGKIDLGFFSTHKPALVPAVVCVLPCWQALNYASVSAPPRGQRKPAAHDFARRPKRRYLMHRMGSFTGSHSLHYVTF